VPKFSINYSCLDKITTSNKNRARKKDQIPGDKPTG